MITKDKEYISGVLKTFGLSLFAPVGSMFFQSLLFRKSIFEGYFWLSLLISLIGILLLYGGYNVVKEKRN